MFGLIFKIFGFVSSGVGVLKKKNVGNTVIYWVIGIIGIIIAYIIYTIDRDNKVSHMLNEEYKQQIEKLENDNRHFFEIAQTNAQAFSAIREYQEKLFDELDKVTESRIRLNQDIQKIRERTIDDEDGDIAPVLLNTIYRLHNKKIPITSTTGDNNKSREK